MARARSEKMFGRREFLKAGAAATVAAGASGTSTQSEAATVAANAANLAFENGKERTWIGPDFWSNRFQDWRLKDGIAECLTGEKGNELRTLGLLTYDIAPGANNAQLAARFTPLSNPDANGFAGFLIGVGGGELDYRAAALAQRGPGEKGGFMAVVDTHGRVAFRDHSNETAKLEYPVLGVSESSDASSGFVAGGFTLVLEIIEGTSGYDLSLTSRNALTGKRLGFARRKGVEDAELLGGLSLLSSPEVGLSGARWGISDLAFSGDKLAAHPERALGPVMGTLHSLSESVLKISAQFMPVGRGDPDRASFQYRAPGSARWNTGDTAEIGDGFAALFRVDDWNSAKTWEFRIVFARSDKTLWAGTIRQDPGAARDLVVGLYSCISYTGRSLEGGGPEKTVPQERVLGRFTPENFYFPHNDLVSTSVGHDPDVLLFCGDQYYEHNPIRVGRDSPYIKLDTLYRWYLWYWTLRDLVRDRPTIVLIDDHDVLHGNIWGEGGIESPERNQNRGGYAHGVDFVRMVHRVQCGHNPDAYDSTPVENEIPVYYGEFYYGGVSFAVVEDRKWKTTPMQGTNLDVHVAELLGERQETFLRDWKAMRPGSAKVLVSQSTWACPQTSPAGEPLVDFDSNGYPPLARRKAITLVKEAGAVMLAGDQHLASLLRHGIDDFDDGPIQFSGPAKGAYWQRWFAPAEKLSNPRFGVPHTGDFIDGFGNKLRMLAVANPKITFAQYREHVEGRRQNLMDPALKSEGLGIVRVSTQDKAFTFECWSVTPDSEQYPGWPVQIEFDEV